MLNGLLARPKVELIAPTWAVGLLVASALANSWLPRLQVRPEYPSVPGKLFGGLALFDASNYMTIAQNGYITALPGLKAFFPFFPLLLHVAALPLSWLGYPTNLLIAGTALNLIAFLTALFVLRKLVLLDYPLRVASITMLLVAVFPFSFFFVAIYTEALFLLLSVSSIYYARLNKWFPAALFAAAASATRLPGIILFFILAVEVLHQSQWRVGKLSLRHSWILLAPLGTVSYFLYLQLTGGIGAYRQAYLVSWPTRHLTLNPLASIAQPLASLVLRHHIRPNNLMGLVVVVFGAVGFYLAVRQRMRTSYLVFAFFSLALPLFSGSLDSLGRYYMLIFPLFLAYASILGTQANLLLVWAALSIAACLGLMGAFISGLFVG